ncbi:hypothetical protein F5Y03DRAFT_410666 [Xylaria venustula]|nr:hypothetical protein F5Y03DRAFT_410666 [Xylaria venustula]
MTPRVVCTKVSSTSARSAWSRDFSDSIVRPTDDFKIFPAERFAAVSRRHGYHHGEGTVVAVEGVKPAAPVGRYGDPFTRGRILQSAGDIDDENQRDERRVCAPARSQSQSYVPVPVIRAQAQADLEPEPGISGVDVQAIARGIVFAADVFVRMAEVYQRLRDDEASENEGGEDGDDDDDLGLELDPYHLEAGPPRRCRSVPRASPKRKSRGNKLTATVAAAIGTPDETQGRTGSDYAIAMRTLSPLSAAKRVCYYLIATAILGIAASFGIAMWWALSQGDASTGFTMAGYVIAVDALVAAIVGVVHGPGCRCWKA